MSHNHGPVYSIEESIMQAMFFLARDGVQVQEITIDKQSFNFLKENFGVMLKQTKQGQVIYNGPANRILISEGA